MRGSRFEKIEERTDAIFGLSGMPHCSFSVDEVVVAPADPTPDDDFCVDEVGDDSLCGPLGDPDPFGDVPEPDIDVLGDAQKNLRVVRQEGPGRPRIA